VKANQEIEVTIENATLPRLNHSSKKDPLFLTNQNSMLNFKHKDSQSLEFNRDPLIPYASTNLGPDIAVADVNNDSLEDLFITGGKSQASQLFIQKKEGDFYADQNPIFSKTAIHEDVSAIFFDANNDESVDLLVVSGGNEFRNGKPLQPKLYLNVKGKFKLDTIQFNGVEVNASKVRAIDIDNDGDQDISITSNLVPWSFGETPLQYIFENNGLGNFEDVTSRFSDEFKHIGNVQDIEWVDVNQDSYPDAIVVGYWMPISLFINDGKKLIHQKNNDLENTNGWWNAVKAHDFDNDGDLDFIAGNWGLNTRLNASLKTPITLYRNDFDDNETIDPVITYFYQGEETPFASKDDLAKQLPFLNKKYLSYEDFAEATFTELFPISKIREADKKYVYDLASCYFENIGNNKFRRRQLPFKGQISSINDIALNDFNNDGYMDALFVGNNYNISTQLGKLDASHGQILLNNKKGFFEMISSQNFNVNGESRNIEKIKIKDDLFYVFSMNNDTPIFVKSNK